MCNKNIVLQIMPEFGLAGAEIMCESLVYEFLKHEECEVVVVSLYDYQSAITQRLEKRGVNVIYLDKKQGTDFTIIRKLIKVIKQYRISVVHTHRYVMEYAIPAAMLAGVKTRIHTVHNIAKGEMGRLHRFLAKCFYKFCNVVPVAISPLIKRSVQEEYRLSDARIQMVYNGIDLSRCSKKTIYSFKSTFRFIHVGRLVPVKNQELIIKAVKVLVDDRYNVVVNFLGEGDREEYYKSLVKEYSLEDNISFLGLKDEVCSFLADSDAFLLPSVYEGMPITLIEAMGTGLPIIASNVGGIPDMITHEREGLLVEPTIETLVSAMKRLIEDEALRSFLGTNAYNRSRLFSSENMYNGYLKLYAN